MSTLSSANFTDGNILLTERTQTSTEMGSSCQQNWHYAATNHLSGRGLVQPIKELSSVAGRCAGRGCALIRQLANWVCKMSISTVSSESIPGMVFLFPGIREFAKPFPGFRELLVTWDDLQ